MQFPIRSLPKGGDNTRAEGDERALIRLYCDASIQLLPVASGITPTGSSPTVSLGGAKWRRTFSPAQGDNSALRLGHATAICTIVRTTSIIPRIVRVALKRRML